MKINFLSFLLILLIIWLIIIFSILLKVDNDNEDYNTNGTLNSFINNNVSLLKNKKKQIDTNYNKLQTNPSNNNSITSSIIKKEDNNYIYYENIFHFWIYDDNLFSLLALNSFESFLFSFPYSNHIIILMPPIIKNNNDNDKYNILNNNINIFNEKKFKNNFYKYILLGYKIKFSSINPSLLFFLTDNKYISKWFSCDSHSNKCLIKYYNNQEDINQEDINQENFEYSNNVEINSKDYSLNSNLYSFQDQKIPYHVHIYLRISYLYLYGGVANDFQYILYDEKNNQNERLRNNLGKNKYNLNKLNLTSSVIDDGYHMSYICYTNEEISSTSNTKDNSIRNKFCSISSLFFSYKPHDSTLFCILNKYNNDYDFLSCTEKDDFSILKCIRNIFAQCYNMNNKRNQLISLGHQSDETISNDYYKIFPKNENRVYYNVEDFDYNVLNVYNNLTSSVTDDNLRILTKSTSTSSLPIIYNSKRKKKISIVLLGPLVKKNLLLNEDIQVNSDRKNNFLNELNTLIIKKNHFNFLYYNNLDKEKFYNENHSFLFSSTFSYISSSILDEPLSHLSYSSENFNDLPLSSTKFSTLSTSNLIAHPRNKSISYHVDLSPILNHSDSNVSDFLFPSPFSYISNFDSTMSTVLLDSLSQSVPFILSSTSLNSFNSLSSSSYLDPIESFRIPLSNITSLYPELTSTDPLLLFDQNLINFSTFNYFLPYIIKNSEKEKKILFLLRDPVDYIYYNYLNYLNHNYEDFFLSNSSNNILLSHRKSRAKILENQEKEEISLVSYSFDKIIFEIISDQSSSPSKLRKLLTNGENSTVLINFYFNELKKYEENVKKFDQIIEKNDKFILKKLKNYLNYLLISSFYYPLILHYTQVLNYSSSIKLLHYDSYFSEKKFYKFYNEIIDFYEIKNYFKFKLKKRSEYYEELIEEEKKMEDNNIQENLMFSKIKSNLKNNLLNNLKKINNNELNLFNNLLINDINKFIIPSKNIYKSLMNFYLPSIKQLENFNIFLQIRNQTLYDTIFSQMISPQIIDSKHRLRGSSFTKSPSTFPTFFNINENKLEYDKLNLSFNISLWYNLMEKEKIFNNEYNQLDEYKPLLDLSHFYYNLMENISYVPQSNHSYSNKFWFDSVSSEQTSFNSSIFNIIPLLISSKDNNEENNKEGQYNSTLGLYNTF